VGQQAHIGLSPLGSGDWESGKCGLKQLLYMALALPAVASHAGVHPEIVTDGLDGLLVRDEDSLEAALDRLLSDAAYRARLGLAARMTLERRYSLRAVTPQLAAVLHAAAERA
jgi:glycosyltransferase involved in cell wall biosynthesis